MFFGPQTMGGELAILGTDPKMLVCVTHECPHSVPRGDQEFEDVTVANLFSKTDLAKFLNVWMGHPEIVSRGAQKNFANFADTIGKEWDRQPDAFNEAYFHEAIAKVIVFREAEALVSKQPWYQGGYRANVVAYAIAKIGHDAAALGKSVDFERIWREQKVAPALLKALEVAATEVNDVITSTDGNVTEWAKQPACWTRVSELHVTWPAVWLRELVGQDQVQARRRDAVKDQKMLNGIQAQTAVVKAGGELWTSVRKWAIEKRLISEMESGILGVAASVPDKIPSEKQSLIAIATLQRLHTEGCQIGLDVLAGVTV